MTDARRGCCHDDAAHGCFPTAVDPESGITRLHRDERQACKHAHSSPGAQPMQVPHLSQLSATRRCG